MLVIHESSYTNSSYGIDAVPANFINTHMLVTKEFITSCQNSFHSTNVHVTRNSNIVKLNPQFGDIQSNIDKIIVNSCIWHCNTVNIVKLPYYA